MLVHQVDTRLAERVGSAPSNFTAALPAPDSELAQQLVRDPYVFDHLALSKRAAERELEQALMDRLQAGKGGVGQCHRRLRGHSAGARRPDRSLPDAGSPTPRRPYCHRPSLTAGPERARPQAEASRATAPVGPPATTTPEPRTAIAAPELADADQGGDRWAGGAQGRSGGTRRPRSNQGTNGRPAALTKNGR